MKNFRTISFAVAVAAVILGCGLGSTPAAPADNVATIVAATMQAIAPATPAATATQAQATAEQGIPVSYKNVSFLLQVGLASDAAPATVAEAGQDAAGPWSMAPEHIEFQLNNYNVPAGAFSMHEIHVYPAAEYASLHMGANITLQRLQGLLASPSTTISTENLPQVPFFNAAAMLVAQARRINFQNGAGVRVVSQYGQAVLPIANDSVFYQFVGLTNDGKYLIIAVLPVQAPVLQASQNPSSPLPPGGVPFPDMSSSGAQAYQTYFQSVTDKLNSTDPANFQPSLAALDALVESLSVQP